VLDMQCKERVSHMHSSVCSEIDHGTGLHCSHCTPCKFERLPAMVLLNTVMLLHFNLTISPNVDIVMHSECWHS
jgi:hypothetical protein